MAKKQKKGIIITLGIVGLTLLAGAIGAGITTSLTLNVDSDQAIINNSIAQVQSNLNKFIKVKNNLKKRFSVEQIIKDFTIQQVKENIEITSSNKSVIFTITGKSLATSSKGTSLILNVDVKKNNLVLQMAITIENFLKSKIFDTNEIDKLILNKPAVNLTTQAIKLQNVKTAHEFINIFNTLSEVEKNNYFSFGSNGVSQIGGINLKVISFALEKKINTNQNKIENFLVATIEASKGEIKKNYEVDFTSFIKKQEFVKKQELDLAISAATELGYEAVNGATNLQTSVLLDQIQNGFVKASDYFKTLTAAQTGLLYKISKIEINSKDPSWLDLTIIVSALNPSLNTIQKIYKTSVGEFQTSKLVEVKAMINDDANQINYELINDAKGKVSVNEVKLANYFTTFFKTKDDEKTILDPTKYTYKIIRVEEEKDSIIPIVELSSIAFPQIKISYQAKAINKALLLSVSQRQKALFDLYALVTPNHLIKSLKGNSITTILPSNLIITNFSAPILNQDSVKIYSIGDPSKTIDSHNDPALKNLFVPTLSFADVNIPLVANDINGTVELSLVLSLGVNKKSFKYIKTNLFTESRRKEHTLLSAAHSKIAPTLKLASKNKLPSEIGIGDFNVLIKNQIKFEVKNIIRASANDNSGKLITSVEATLLNDNSITPVIYEVEISNLKSNTNQLIAKLNDFVAQQPVPLFKGNIGEFLAQQSGHPSIKFGDLQNDESGFFYNDYDIDALKGKTKFMTGDMKNVLIQIQELKNFEIEKGIVDIVINAFDRLPNGTKNPKIFRQYEVRVSGFKKLAQFKAERISANQLNVYEKATSPIINLKPSVDKLKISIDSLTPQDFIFTSIDRPNLKTEIGNIIAKPNEPTTAIVQIRIIGFGESANKTIKMKSELIFEVEFPNFISVSQQQNLNIINTFIKDMELNNAFIYPTISPSLHKGDIRKTRIDEINDPTKQLIFKPSNNINGNILEVLSLTKINLESGTIKIKVTRLADNGKNSISRSYSIVLKGFVSRENQINQIRLEDSIEKGVKARVSVLASIKATKSISMLRKNEVALIAPPSANNPYKIVFKVLKIVTDDKDDTKAIITIRATLAAVFFDYTVEEIGFLSGEKEKLSILIQQKILSKELALTEAGQLHLAQEVVNEDIAALKDVGTVSFKIEILKDDDDKPIVKDNKVKIKITATNSANGVFASFNYFLGGFQAKAQDDVDNADKLNVSILDAHNIIIGSYTKASGLGADKEQKGVPVVTIQSVIDMVAGGIVLSDVFKIAPNNNLKVKYQLISFTKNPSSTNEGSVKVKVTSTVDETATREYEQSFTFLSDLEFRRLTLLNDFIKNPSAKGVELGFKSILPSFENNVSTFSAADLSLSDITLPILEKNEDANAPKVEVIISNGNSLVTFRVSPTSSTSIIFRIPIVVGTSSDGSNFKDFYEVTVSGFKDPSKAFNDQALNDYVTSKDIRQDPTLIASKAAQKGLISGRTIINPQGSDNILDAIANFNLQRKVEIAKGIITQDIINLALVDKNNPKEIEITVAVSLGSGVNMAKNFYKVRISGFASDKKESNFAKLQAFLTQAQVSYPAPNLAPGVLKSNYSTIDVVANLANFVVAKQNAHPDVSFSIDSARVKLSDDTVVIIVIRAKVGEGANEVSKTYEKAIFGFLTPAQFLNTILAKNYRASSKRNNPTLNSNIVESRTSVNELTLKDFSIGASTDPSIILKLVSVEPKGINRKIAIVTTSITAGKGTDSEVTIFFTIEFSGFIAPNAAQNIKKLQEYMKNVAARRLPTLIASKVGIIGELFSGDIDSSDLTFSKPTNGVNLSISSVTIKLNDPTTIIVTILATVGINKDQASDQYTHEITGFTTQAKAILFSLLRRYIATIRKEIPLYNSSIIKLNRKAADTKVVDFKILPETTFQGKKITFLIKSVAVNPNDPTEVIVIINVTTTDAINNTVTKTYTHNIGGFADVARLAVIKKVKAYINDATTKLEYKGVITKNKMATTKLITSDFSITQPTDPTISVSIEDVKAKSTDPALDDQKIALVTLFASIGDPSIPNLFYKKRFVKEVPGFAKIVYGENNFILHQYLKKPTLPVLISPSIKNEKSPAQIVLSDLTIQQEVANGQITLKIIKVEPNAKISNTIDVSVRATIGIGANQIVHDYIESISAFISNDQFLVNQFVSKKFVPTIFFSDADPKVLAKNVDNNNANFVTYQTNLQKVLPSELKKTDFTFNTGTLADEILTTIDPSFNFEITTFKNNVPTKEIIPSSLFTFNFEILDRKDEHGTLTLKITVLLNPSEINLASVSKSYTVTFANVRRFETSEQRKVSTARELSFGYEGPDQDEISASELSISNFKLEGKPISGLNYSLDSNIGVQILDKGKTAKLTIIVAGESNQKSYVKTISGFLTSKKSENRKAVLNVFNSNEKPEPAIINTKKTVDEFIAEFDAASDEEKFKLYVELDQIPSKRHNPKVKVKPLRVEPDLDKAIKAINVFQLSQGSGDDIFVQEYSFVNSAFQNAVISSLNKIKNNIVVKAFEARSKNTPNIQLLKIKNGLINKLAIPSNVSNTSFEFDSEKINDIVGVDDFDAKFKTAITLKRWKREFTTFGFYSLKVEITEKTSNKKITFDVNVLGFATVKSLVEDYIKDKANWRLPELKDDAFDKWKDEASLQNKKSDYELDTANVPHGLKIELEGLFIKQDDKSVIRFIIKVSREATINLDQKSFKFHHAKRYNYDFKDFKQPLFEHDQAYRIQIKEDGTLINKYISKVDYEAKYKKDNNEAAKIRRLEIRSDQITIETNQFKNLINLSELILNEGIENIGVEAFADSPSLISIKLPSSIKTIGDRAFNKSALTSLSDLEKTSLVFLDKTVFSKAFPGIQTQINTWKFKKIQDFKLIRIKNLKIDKRPFEIDKDSDLRFDTMADAIKKNNASILISPLLNQNDVLGSFTLKFSIIIEQLDGTSVVKVFTREEVGYLSDLTKFAKENQALSVMDPTQTNLVKLESATLDGKADSKTVVSVADFRSDANKFSQSNIKHRPQYAKDPATNNYVLRFSTPPQDLDSDVHDGNDLISANDYLANPSFSNPSLEQGVIYIVFKDTTTHNRRFMTLLESDSTALHTKAYYNSSLSLTYIDHKDVVDVLGRKIERWKENWDKDLSKEWGKKWGEKNKWKILEITKTKTGEQKFEFRIFCEEDGPKALPKLNEINYNFARFWELNHQQFGGNEEAAKTFFNSLEFSKNSLGTQSVSFVGDIGAFVIFDDVAKDSNFAGDLAKRNEFVNILRKKWFKEVG